TMTMMNSTNRCACCASSRHCWKRDDKDADGETTHRLAAESKLSSRPHQIESGRKSMKTIITVTLFAGLALTARSSEKLPGPLFDGLGDLHHPITTESKQAQRYFDQGLRLLFGFNHREAIRSFRSAAHFDPQCAMAYWGVAYAYGPHVNRPMDSNDTAQAWTALRLAVANKTKVSAKEQAYISALEKRYVPEHKEDRLALDKAFAVAMREVTKHYLDDLDAQVLFAESLMNTMPWDYWTRDRTPKSET